MDKETKISITEVEAVGIVRKFITENNKGVGFVVTGTDYNKERNFWIISGEIKSEFDKEIWDILSAIINLPPSEFATVMKELQVDNSIKKISEHFNFCFYVNSYGKICAISPYERFTPIVEKETDDIKSEEKDVNDICKKAKEILGEGTTFKYVDYIPVLVVRREEKWQMLMIVIYYARFDVFPKVHHFSFSSEGSILSFKGFEAGK